MKKSATGGVRIAKLLTANRGGGCAMQSSWIATTNGYSTMCFQQSQLASTIATIIG